ncbi:MAG TPA: SDR family NAD(P)-dependent oxidoreductase [Novosphingobium sp.]|nr:SDR family NAD(P)-dependent oxidoreductase [Novosphingobium sp.]
MNRYEGKVAVVTASAAGIGRAIVERLIAEGATVLATSRNGADALAEELGARCHSLKVDISSEEQIINMIDVAKERFGKIDVAFNVANGASLGTILGSTAEQWRVAFDVSVIGTFNCVRHEARHMIENGVKGAIVNVASLNAETPARGLSAYSCAKAAIVMLAKACSIEMAEYGIRVNTLSPGLTRTPVNSEIPEAMEKAFMDRIPVGRQATPNEQAEAALFLGSDQSSYMYGHNLVVDGGWSNSGYPDTRLWFGPFLDDKLG